MGDESFSSETKGKKRKMDLEGCAPIKEYSSVQKPYHLIPRKRKDEKLITCTSNEGKNFVQHRKSKKQNKGVVDHHPYRISLFDTTLDSGSLCKKREKRDEGGQNTGYPEVLRWEKELIHDHVDALKAMFEFKQIYMFIRKQKKRLNFSDIPLYIVERMFLMPRESTHLASVMTALLNHYFYLKEGYSPEAPMPYQLWNSHMKMKISEWYEIVDSFGGDTMTAANYIGFEHDFFVVLGPTNPLNFCDFHDLNLLQRVWIVKCLCDSLSFQEETSDESDDEHNGSLSCPGLGTDRHEHYYSYFSYSKRQENLRVYRINNYFSPKSDSFYGRTQHENHGQVAPNKKCQELVADDVQSLRSLASKFAKPQGTEKASSQVQNSGKSAKPDCESKLHQKLLELLSKVEPLESSLKLSTLKMLMLLKSDWDRYHSSGVSSVNERFVRQQHNYGNDIEARNSRGETSNNHDDGRPTSPVQHFLVTVFKNKKNAPQLKSIVPHLKNVHKGQKLNLPNVCITPLKKLNNESQIGVEILTPVTDKDGSSSSGSSNQIVVCDSKVYSRNNVTTEDSDSNDSVLIVESDTSEENDLNPAAASLLVKNTGGKMDWEALSDSSSNSSEIPVESSHTDVSEKVKEKDKSDFGNVLTNVHKPVWSGPKQECSCESGGPENVEELSLRVSKSPVANRHQPLVIHIGSKTDSNSKGIQLSSYDKNQDKSEDVKKIGGLPSVVYKHTNDVSPEPKTSALSVEHTAENNRRSSRVNTARKSCTPSLRRPVAIRENKSTLDHGESSSRMMIHANVSSGSVNPSLCTKFAVTGTDVKHVMSINEGSVKILKAIEAQNSSQVTKYPIVSLNVFPHMISNGSVHPVISLKKVASSSEIIHSEDTSSHRSVKSVMSKSLITSKNTTQRSNQLTVSNSNVTSPTGRVSSFNNHSVVLGEGECVEVINESLNISNKETYAKSFPASQQLIYTLSPMEMSFTTRNSLETCISATKDHLRAGDASKKSTSQENESFCRNETQSSNILADNAEKGKICNKNNNTPPQKAANSCKPVLKSSSSSLISSVTTAPATCISNINSELSVVNLTENSEDCSKFGKHLKKSARVVSLSHQSTASINPSDNISGSAAGTDASTDFSTVAGNSDTELIPVVLPDGKQILLRLITSQSVSTKNSLSNSSNYVSLLKNNTPQTVVTELSKNNTDTLQLLPSKAASMTKTLEVSQISSTISSGPASEDSCSGDSESNTRGKGRKFGNQNSSEKVQKSRSSDETPVLSLMGKVGKRLTYAQKIQEMLKSSDSYDDVTVEECVDVVTVEESVDVVTAEKSVDVVPVEKSAGVVTEEVAMPAKKKLKVCASDSNSSVSMPKVKKVEIPMMASKILSNLTPGGAAPIETSSSPSSVVSVSLCNTVNTSQVVNVNSGTVGFTGPINQAPGNTLNILNAGGGAPGGIIILGQPQTGNSTFFAQPAVPVNQPPLLLIPSVVSTPCAQPLTAPASYTAPLLSSPVNPGSNSIVSSSSVSNSQPLVFLCQNQLYMVPPVVAPVTPSSSQVNNFTSQSQASSAVEALVPPVITPNALPVVIAPVSSTSTKVNNSASQSQASTAVEASVQPVITSNTLPVVTAPVSQSPSKVSNCASQSQDRAVEAEVPAVVTSSALSAVIASVPPSSSKGGRHSRAATTKSSSVNRSTGCKSNKENESEDGWVVVADPLELKKKVQQVEQPHSQQTVSRNFTVNFFPKPKENDKKEDKKKEDMKEAAVAPSSGSLYPEFPANVEPPVLASNKKATDKHDLISKSKRPPLTLDEPITVIPSRKQDMQQQ